MCHGYITDFFNKAKVRKSMAIPSKFDMAQARGSDKSGP